MMATTCFLEERIMSTPISAVSKICCKCKRDVAHEPRRKDQTGTYYCHPCWDIAAATVQLAKTAAVSNPLPTVQPTLPNRHKASGRRNLLILVGVVIVALTVFLYEFEQARKAREDAIANITAGYDPNDHTSTPMPASIEEPKVSLEDLVNSDPTVSAFLERFPDLRIPFVRLNANDVESINLKTELMVATSIISLSDARYLQQFAANNSRKK
jgi:hypothetical protein